MILTCNQTLTNGPISRLSLFFELASKRVQSDSHQWAYLTMMTRPACDICGVQSDHHQLAYLTSVQRTPADAAAVQSDHHQLAYLTLAGHSSRSGLFRAIRSSPIGLSHKWWLKRKPLSSRECNQILTNWLVSLRLTRVLLSADSRTGNHAPINMGNGISRIAPIG